MAADLFNTIRNNLLTVANQIGGLQSNALGTVDFNDGTEWLQDLNNTGPSVIILSTKGQVDGQYFNGEFIVPVVLFYTAQQDASYDYTASDYFVARLVESWVTYSEFVKGGTDGPFTIEWEAPFARTDLTPMVFETDLTLTFKMVGDQISGQKILTTNGTSITIGGKFVMVGA